MTMERRTSKQDGLNELVAQRIQQKLSKGMNNVQSATTRLMEEGKMQRDFLFEVGVKKKGAEPMINFIPDERSNRLGATFNMPKGREQFTFNDWATRQVAEKLSIPTAYLIALLTSGEDWKKTLGYEILNSHNGYQERNKVLVRAIGKEVRGVLSDSYRILDSEMIFATHIEEVFAQNAELSDGYMDDTRLMMESLLPTPIRIATPLNGDVFVAFGMRITTSDVGAGLLAARSFIMQGVCLNGLVTESVVKEKHLGSRMNDSQGILSRETYRLDSEATASAIRDITKHLYSTSVIKDKMLQIEASATDTVDPVNVLSGLRGMGKLLKGEEEAIGQLLMRNEASRGIQGESTLWKLTQGITAYANEESISDSRRMDLQEIAGELFKKSTIKN